MRDWRNEPRRARENILRRRKKEAIGVVGREEKKSELKRKEKRGKSNRRRGIREEREGKE